MKGRYSMSRLRNCLTSSLALLALSVLSQGSAFASNPPHAKPVVPVALAAAAKSQLASELNQYFGANKSPYLPMEGSIYDQFSTVIFASAGEVTMNDGDVFITSVDAANPKVRASVLTGPDGSIKGAALIHYGCQKKEGSYACADDMHPVMTIFLRNYDSADQITTTFVIGKFRRW